MVLKDDPMERINLLWWHLGNEGNGKWSTGTCLLKEYEKKGDILPLLSSIEYPSNISEAVL